MSNPASLKYQLLAELLQTLEAAGYQFGIEKHLHIRQLLGAIPEDTAIEDLREILAPVICNNEQDQIFFYDIFPVCLERARAVHDPVAAVIIEEKTNFWPLWIALLSAVLLAALIFVVREEAEDIIGKPKELEPRFQTVRPDSTEKICINKENLIGLDSIINSWICNDSLIRRGESPFGVFSLEDNICLRYQARDTLGKDTICITLVDSSGHQSNIIFYPTIEKEEISTADSTAEQQIEFTKRAFLFPTAESVIRERLEVEPLSTSEAFLVDNAWWLKPLLMLLLGALLWSILKFRDQKRQKLVAEVETRDKAPYIWDIEIDGIDAIEMNTAFVRSVHQLRRRTLGEHFVLDIPKTVKTTIEKAGMINFAYSQQTRPPEYLLLIDRQNAANHQALVYDLLFRAFRKNEIIVERFFYDDDPRDCYNEAFPDGISIRELQLRFYNTRLIILGNAYQLLNPFNGKLARWTEIFTQWRERSILTTCPTNDWGRDERRLGELFHILPASIQGFEYLIEQLDAGEDADYDSWPEHVKDATKRSIQLEGSLINSLKQHYPEEMLVWIAACAVYPSLHWDLSLHLGELLSNDDKLLQIDRLLDLSRLPWFTQGEIPKQARAVLIEWMEEAHPATLSKVRHALNDILQQTAPPDDSAVWEEYSMNVALNEWLITEDEQKKQALEDRIADMLEKGVEADFTIIKYLDRERSPLDFIVPDTWKKYVHKGGHSGLGMKDFWKDALHWALPIWLIFSLGILWYQPETECNGDPVEYNEGEDNEWRVNLASNAENVVFLNNSRDFIATMMSGHPALFNHKGKVIQEFVEEEGRATVGLSIQNMDVDPLNQKLIANYDNGRVEVWSLNGELENSVLIPSTQGPSILRAIPGQNLFLHAQGTEAVLMDFEGTQVKTFRIENGPVSALAVSSDGQFCAMAGTDNIVKAWSLDGSFKQSTEENLDQEINEGKGLRISALTFSPDGKTLIAGSTTGHVILFDVETGERSIDFPARLQSGEILDIATSSSGNMIFAGNEKGYSVVSDYAGNLIRAFVDDGSPVIKVWISDDGESVRKVSDKGVVKSENVQNISPSQYCLDSNEDYILWREYLAHKAIVKGDHKTVERLSNNVDSIYSAAYQSFIDANGTVNEDLNRVLYTAHMSFNLNIGTEYYNIAIGYANESDQFIQQSIKATSSARDSACLYFKRAVNFLNYDSEDDSEAILLMRDFCSGGEKPIVVFSVSESECCMPCNIEISNRTTNADRYVWSFGDGNFSVDEIPKHTYTKTGAYQIKLVASKNGIIDSMSQSVLVKSCEELNADQDQDGVPDSKDDCPNTDRGVKVNSAGCPDQDSDGVRDIDDDCPTQAGTIQNNGCPEVDLEERKARFEKVVIEKRKDFATVLKKARDLNSPQVDKYGDLKTKDFLALSKEAEQKIKGTEDITVLSKDYRKKVDEMIEEMKQYITKVEAGNAPAGSSFKIAKGETYIVKKNERLEVDEWVMGAGAIIKFAEGVTSFKLTAQTVDIAYGARIEGAGKDGSRGQNGTPGKNGDVCERGIEGKDGSNGTSGSDGVDIVLRIGEVKSFDGLNILVNGGNGGAGGNGGNGGNGGESRGEGEKCECGPYNGGSGGNGGNGGNPGEGGDVIVEALYNFSIEGGQGYFESLKKLIRIENYHGRSGQLGEAGKGGDAGKRTSPACNPARPGPYGASGTAGANPASKRGIINFINNR